VAHGFTYKAITGLVDSVLATSAIEPFLADGRVIEVTRFRITEAGRVARIGPEGSLPSRLPAEAPQLKPLAVDSSFDCTA